MTLTLRVRFRPRPAAVRLACTSCESRRAWLRSHGVRRWGAYRASCPDCAARAGTLRPDPVAQARPVPEAWPLTA